MRECIDKIESRAALIVRETIARNLDIHVGKPAPRQIRKPPTLPVEEYLSYFSPADRAFVRRALNLPTVTKKR